MRDSRRAIRNDADTLLERADGEPLVLGVGEVLPFSPTRRRAASLPIDVARTIEEALANLTLDLVHVHEPFAPSASSVALRHSRGAERRQLPRADRADPLDPAHRPAVAAAVRAARCPHRQLRRDPGPAPALLPRRLPGDPPGRRRRRGAHRARSRAAAVQRRARSAARFGSSCARCGRSRPTPDWRATVWSPRPLTRAGDAQPGRCASGSSSSTPSGCPRPRRWPGRTCSCSPPRGSGRRRARSCGRSPAASCPSPRGCRSTRSCSARASSGSSSSPATRRRSPLTSGG